MKNSVSMQYALYAIFLVLFNAVFFVMGGLDHKASVWISWVFIHFAYAMLLCTPRLCQAGKNASVLGWALIAVSSAYFLLAFVVGVIFILVAPDGYKAAFLVQLCLAGLYGVVLLSNMIANTHTVEALESRHPQIEYIKTITARLESLLENVADKQARKKVEAAFDEIHSSPVKSHPTMAEVESKLLASVAELENAVEAQDNSRISASADSLLKSIKERNRQMCLHH